MSENSTKAKRAAWESTLGRVSWSYEDFERATAEWTFHPVRGGAIATNGPEIHACIFQGSLSKKALSILWNTIAKHGYAVTSCDKNNEVGIRFISKLGFKPTELKGNTQYWRLDHGD